MQKTGIQCCVPFCERMTKRNMKEYICPKHWRGASPGLRREYNRLKKLYHRTPDSSESSETERRRLYDRSVILWRQIKSQALDTALFED